MLADSAPVAAADPSRAARPLARRRQGAAGAGARRRRRNGAAGRPGRQQPRAGRAGRHAVASGLCDLHLRLDRPAQGRDERARGVVNRLLWMQDAFALGADDVVLQKTPYSFDVSVWEFFWPLQVGASLVIARPDGHKQPDYLARLIEDSGVTTLHFVPSMLQAFVEQCGHWHGARLKHVFCSGEALPAPLRERFRAMRPDIGLHNLYGPTEAAVDVTWHDCRDGRWPHAVPIGRPIANTQIYILDGRGAAGAAGRGGGDVHRRRAGGARLPEPAALTAERFVADPFGGGRRAPVPDRRPGAVACRRQRRVPGPQRLPGQDPRAAASSSARSRAQLLARAGVREAVVIGTGGQAGRQAPGGLRDRTRCGPAHGGERCARNCRAACPSTWCLAPSSCWTPSR